jgi:small subunit ribosomal protein S17
MEKTITKTNNEARRKQLEGVVVSDKMKDTVVVLIERYVKDDKYHKFLNIRKRFKVHNPGNTVKVGDKVIIESCRPISRHKSFVVVSANGAAVATTK